MTMDIQARTEEGVIVLDLRGSLDGTTAEILLHSLSEHIRAGSTRLVADFREVDYTSSAGLRALLGSLKEARSSGGDLRLAGVAPAVYRVLQLSGFTGILKTFDDASAAVRSYGA
jgi:anti-sigma B factor antagonist